jgi:manganese/zinc/iron transport system permease protein
MAMNPYWGCDFFQFFSVLMGRVLNWLSGNGQSLASDELQILILIAIAIACSLIGTFLVVRKMTMVANSLSHTILIGIVIAALFFSKQEPILSLPILLLAAFTTALITIGLSYLISRSSYVKEDASIGLSFTTLFALGLLALMLFAKDTHLGTEAVMGNLDAAHKDDLVLAWGISLIDALFICFTYPWLKIFAFDSQFASSIRLPIKGIDLLFLLLVSATLVAAFRAVGVVIVLAFLTGPVLAARLLSHQLFKIIMISIGLGVIVAILAVALARHILSVYEIPLSTAGLAATLTGFLFITVFLLTRFDFRSKEC